MGQIKKYFSGFIFFLLFWQILSLIFPDYIIPAPSLVFAKIPEFMNISFFEHLYITLIRLIAGFSIAFLSATTIGIAVYQLKIYEYAENILSLLQVIPGAILAIIFLIIFGIGSYVPVGLIILVTMPLMTINTTTALRKVAAEQKEVVYVFGGSTGHVIRYVFIPALIPVFRSNFLIGSSIALKVLVLGEFIGCENGVGFLLSNARTLFRMDLVFTYLLVIVLVALFLQILINFIFLEFFRNYLDLI